MKFSILNRLYNAIPNGSFTDSVLGASYITDRNGNIVGHVDFITSELFINENYEHKDALAKRFDDQNLQYEFKNYAEL